MTNTSFKYEENLGPGVLSWEKERYDLVYMYEQNVSKQTQNNFINIL